MTISDWGTWVGSIGTVAAFWGTIHLATAETRRRHSEALALAQLHSIGMRLRLKHAELMLEELAERFSALNAEETSHDYFAKAHKNFQSIEVWTVEDLLPLIALPNNASAKLAQALDELRVIQRVLKQLDERYEALDKENRALLVRGLHPNMASTAKLITDALVTVTQAVRDLGVQY